MAFRSFVIDVARGTPQQVLVAGHGDDVRDPIPVTVLARSR